MFLEALAKLSFSSSCRQFRPPRRLPGGFDLLARRRTFSELQQFLDIKTGGAGPIPSLDFERLV